MSEELVLEHPGGVASMASFPGPDGRTLLVSAHDKGIRLWDPVTGDRRCEFASYAGVNGLVVCEPPGRDPILAVSHEMGVSWWDPLTGTLVYDEVDVDTIWGMAVARLPDGSTTLFGAGGGGPFPIHRWDVTTGRVLPALGSHHDHITKVIAARLPGGAVLIAAAGWSHEITRWDPMTSTEVGPRMPERPEGVTTLDSFTLPDGRALLVTGGSDGTVRRWDALAGEQVGPPIVAHKTAAYVRAVMVEDRPQLITTGDDGGVIRRWDALTGQLLDEPATGLDVLLLTVGGEPMIATSVFGSVSLRPLPHAKMVDRPPHR